MITDDMVTKKLHLHFGKNATREPIIFRLVKDFDLVLNIFRAQVTPDEEGDISLEISGTEENLTKACEFLRGLDVEVGSGKGVIRWAEEECTHCGNCITHCPTGALDFVDRTTRRLQFSEDMCVECLSCITNCPYGVCTSIF